MAHYNGPSVVLQLQMVLYWILKGPITGGIAREGSRCGSREALFGRTGAVQAQQAGGDQTSKPNELQEVVVTGIRAALEESLTIKKDSTHLHSGAQGLRRSGQFRGEAQRRGQLRPLGLLREARGTQLQPELSSSRSISVSTGRSAGPKAMARLLSSTRWMCSAARCCTPERLDSSPMECSTGCSSSPGSTTSSTTSPGSCWGTTTG